jgi:pyruvate/2-oxoglutarate dehydrogenase complex dihydrolipoamide dehydrogenase (E3) component
MSAGHVESAVFGGGEGGRILAVQIVAAEQNVVMIEKGTIGRNCIDFPVVPAKKFVKSTKASDLIRRASDFGARRFVTLKVQIGQVFCASCESSDRTRY